jgi:hypothetical protein
MKKRHHKSKTLSYMTNFKCEVVWCTEEKENCRVSAIFAVDDSNIPLLPKHEVVIRECEASQMKFI